MEFFDKVSITTDGKTLTSCRDGIQEYLGSEIVRSDDVPDFDGNNNIYKVYRSADTIKNINLVGIPITDEHVAFDKNYDDGYEGFIYESEIINAKDDNLKKTIEVKNKVKVFKKLQKIINDGKNELSLGYEAKITDVRDKDLGYDFVQSDIKPNHLAIVAMGRCGKGCKFDDKNKNGDKNMDIKTYQNAKDALAGILAIMPMFDAEEEKNLKAKMYKAGEKEETDEEIEARKKKEADMEMEKEKTDMEAEKKKETDMEKEEGTNKEQKDKLIKKGIADHIEVIAKATDLGCLDEKYIFAGKTANQIMGDCIKTQNDGTFKDSELSIAFKMLKKVDNPHANFGDGGTGAKFVDKEIN